MKKRMINMLSPSVQGSLRYYYYRAEGYLHRLRYMNIKTPSGGWPILLGNSYPKSGTNLLSQIISGFSKISPFTPHFPLTFGAVDPKTNGRKRLRLIMKYLNSLRPLDITQAHLSAWPEVVERVCSSDFVSYLIIRDPRDIVVSHVFYVTEIEKGHELHRYYVDNMKTFDERLTASIQGVKNAEVNLQSISQGFDRYLEWFDRPEVLTIRFEQLIHDRHAALGDIVDHFLRRVDSLSLSRDEIIEVLKNSIDPRNSSTFRSGKTGEWRKYFTPEHKDIFKNQTGNLLMKLGYERDSDW